MARFALLLAVALASVAQDGLSGQWTRETGGAPGNGAGFGPGVTITQTGSDVTVTPMGGTPIRYRADGIETSQVISDVPCARQTRITRAASGAGGIVITTWLIRQERCFHGESNLFQPSDPEQGTQTPGTSGSVISTPPTKTLESVTVIYRDGDRLGVETRRPLPNGSTQTTTTTYRR